MDTGVEVSDNSLLVKRSIEQICEGGEWDNWHPVLRTATMDSNTRCNWWQKLIDTEVVCTGGIFDSSSNGAGDREMVAEWACAIWGQLLHGVEVLTLDKKDSMSSNNLYTSGTDRRGMLIKNIEGLEYELEVQIFNIENCSRIQHRVQGILAASTPLDHGKDINTVIDMSYTRPRLNEFPMGVSLSTNAIDTTSGENMAMVVTTGDHIGSQLTSSTGVRVSLESFDYLEDRADRRSSEVINCIRKRIYGQSDNLSPKTRCSQDTVRASRLSTLQVPHTHVEAVNKVIEDRLPLVKPPLRQRNYSQHPRTKNDTCYRLQSAWEGRLSEARVDYLLKVAKASPQRFCYKSKYRKTGYTIRIHTPYVNNTIIYLHILLSDASPKQGSQCDVSNVEIEVSFNQRQVTTSKFNTLQLQVESWQIAVLVSQLSWLFYKIDRPFTPSPGPNAARSTMICHHDN